MNYKAERDMNSVIDENAIVGEGTRIGHNCIVEPGVVLGKNVFVDHNTIIRSGTEISDNSFIGANCILGEYQMDFIRDREYNNHQLHIGKGSIIRSGSIIYCGSNIGDGFQTGHRVTIREDTVVGNHVSVGTLSDIQGHCKIGNYVRMHSSVHVGQASVIDDCCWIYPYVVLTNDPTPPSQTLSGVHIHSFAVIATGSIIIPGVVVGRDALIGAGTIVIRDVPEFAVVLGNPGELRGDVRDIKNRETEEAHYPWRYHFDRAMPWENQGYDTWYSTLEQFQRDAMTLS